MDKYETVPFDGGAERPEYVLKNGKAINVYGLLTDIKALQAQFVDLKRENGLIRQHGKTVDVIIGLLDDAGMDKVEHTAWCVESVIEQRDKAEHKVKELQAEIERLENKSMDIRRVQGHQPKRPIPPRPGNQAPSLPPPPPGAIVMHKTKHTGYRVRGYGKAKINGEWVECIHYETQAGDELFTRTIGDFEDNFVDTGFTTPPTPPSKP